MHMLCGVLDLYSQDFMCHGSECGTLNNVTQIIGPRLMEDEREVEEKQERTHLH